MQSRNPIDPHTAAADDDGLPFDGPSSSAPGRRRWLVPTILVIIAAVTVVALVASACFIRRAAPSGHVVDANPSTAGISSADASPKDMTGSGAEDSSSDTMSTGKSGGDSDDDRARSITAQELRAQLDALFAGASYALQVTDARTGDVRYAIDAGESRVAASTYKLFIAQDMASKVEGGSMTWDSPLNGMSLSDCLTTMIVDSDNDCPIAWMETVSSSPQMTANAQGLGATGTDFRLDGIIRTTAADLTVVLRGLYDHTIVSRDSATRIIDLMERQAYRDGIPAGLGEGDGSDEGITVADKVGFLNGTLNDAAIVYSPKGDFTVVILTEGASWDLIAQAAAIVYDAL